MSLYETFFSRIMSIGAVQRQSMVSFVWQITYTAIALVSTMYFAHTVGAGVLGAYFLFLAYLGIVSMVSDGGLGGAAIKRISEGEEQDTYFSAFFAVRSILVTAVAVALISLRSYFADLDNAGVFVWLLLALIISLFYGAVSYGIAGRGKMGIYSTGLFINNVSAILVQVVVVFLGFGVAGLAGGFVAGMFISAIIELRFFDLRFVRFGWRHIKSLSTFSFWLFLTSSGSLVFVYADTVMIGYFMGNADVGVYKVALQLATAGTFTTHAILQTLWPKVSKWGKTGETELIEASLSRAFSYSLLLAVPVFAGGILLGDRLLYFLFGADFERGYPVLVIWLIVHIINISQFFFTSYLGALNRQKDSFKAMMVAALMNIILNVVLIPMLGIAGAALASLVSMTLVAVLAGYILSKTVTIRVDYNTLSNILKSSVVMSMLVLFYRLLVPLSSIWLTALPIVIGGAVYGILILRFDRKIYEELKEIAAQMNVKTPHWL